MLDTGSHQGSEANQGQGTSPQASTKANTVFALAEAPDLHDITEEAISAFMSETKKYRRLVKDQGGNVVRPRSLLEQIELGLLDTLIETEL